jgi:hypothetical protein
LDFIDGPHRLPIREGDEVPLATWYLRKNGKICKSSIEVSIAFLQEKWATGDYDGILGFSMGGALGALIASYPDEFRGLKFVIVAGAPDIVEIRNLLSLGSIPENVRSLHLMGRTDTAVPMHRSQLLASSFHRPIIVEHAKGHLFPTKACILDFCLSFIVNSCRGVETPTTELQDSDFVFIFPQGFDSYDKNGENLCQSQAIAIAQSDEVEALQAIFPENISEISVLPSRAGDICASFVFDVSAADSSESINNPAVTRQYQRLCSQLKVKFTGIRL